MRLPLRELEEARANPRGYLREYITQQSEPRSGPSAMRYWQYAVYRLHRTGNLPDAIRHFEDLCQRSFVSGLAQQRRLAQYSAYLTEYHRRFESLNHSVIRTSFRVIIKLAKNVEASAEVGRVDLTPQGYAFCLLLKSAPRDWRDQLRMPIVQHLIAAELHVPTDIVKAGIYNLEDERHQWHTYTRAQVRFALTRARRVADQIEVAAREMRHRL